MAASSEDLGRILTRNALRGLESGYGNAAGAGDDVLGGTDNARTDTSCECRDHIETPPGPDSLQTQIICKQPGVRGSRPCRTYNERPGIGNRIVTLLIEGKCPSEVARILDISTSLEKYHRDKAIQDWVIVRIKGSYPHIYEKGPKYREGVYKERKGRRSPKYPYPEVCVHPGNGSSYRIEVLKEGDLHKLKMGNDTLINLFSLEPAGKEGEKHYVGSLAIPADIVGDENLTTTLVFYPSHDPRVPGGRLELSPPKINLNLERLRSLGGSSPFAAIIKFVIKTLANKGGWKFGEIVYQDPEVHYSFPIELVRTFLPGLLERPDIHLLRRGDIESDYVLFTDFSIPRGELETTKYDIAVEILSSLTEAYEELTRGGDR